MHFAPIFIFILSLLTVTLVYADAADADNPASPRTVGTQTWFDDRTQRVIPNPHEPQTSSFTREQYTFLERSQNKFSGERGSVTVKMNFDRVQPGVVVSFYMRSTMENTKQQDEIDFEWGGGRSANQVWLTMHKDGVDMCPWSFDLPFDVTQGDHYYTIQWRYTETSTGTGYTDVAWFADGCMIRNECVDGKMADMYAVVSGWANDGTNPDFYCWMGDTSQFNAASVTQWQVVDTTADVTGATVKTTGDEKVGVSRTCRLGGVSELPSTFQATEPERCQAWERKLCGCSRGGNLLRLP